MFQSFLTTAMLQTLISNSRLLYVGTRSQAVHIAVVQNTLRRLGALRFHQREPGQLHNWTPNTLFDHYVTESNNLPEDCTTWSSPLTSLFYGNLPEDVAIAMTDDPTFSFPSSAQLNSKAQQLAQLSILLTHVNREWTLLTKQTAAFNRICENRLRSLQRHARAWTNYRQRHVGVGHRRQPSRRDWTHPGSLHTGCLRSRDGDASGRPGPSHLRPQQFRLEDIRPYGGRDKSVNQRRPPTKLPGLSRLCTPGS